MRGWATTLIEALRSIVQGVANARDLNTAMELLVVKVKASMKVGVCSVYLDDPKRERYLLMASDGLNRASVGRSYLEYGSGLIGWVADRAETLNTDNAPGHPNYLYLHETGEERYHAFLGVPILHQKRVLGVLVVQQIEPRAFDDAEVSMLMTLSAQLASVVAHAQAVGDQQAFSWQVLGADRRFAGIGAAQGVGMGIAHVVESRELASIANTQAQDPALEEARFKEALAEVKASLGGTADRYADRLRTEERTLFDAYARMLDDDSLAGAILGRIRSGQGAVGAIARVGDELSLRFEGMSDPYLRERGTDVRDLARRLIAAFNADAPAIDWPDQVVLVADELTPAVLGDVPSKNLAGLIAVQGSASSHVAIIARSMGVPCVVGTKDLPTAQLHGLDIVADGYRGLAVVNPSKPTRVAYKLVRREDSQIKRELDLLGDSPAVTADGMPVPLLVNMGSGEGLQALASRAEGCGLSRTEIPFMLETSFPTEAAQAEAYREQLEAFYPKPVTMRTLDIGGDKSLPYFPISEANPFLGWRGIRVSLDHPELFMAQLRAMIKASEGLDNLQILLPMISNMNELDEAISKIHRAWQELVSEDYDVNLPKIGIMIEVPATLYQMPEIAGRVDFVSVGSNDLTQYLLAVDRGNTQVADLYDSYHPAVIRALGAIAAAGKSAALPVSICGELAGDPIAVPLLVAMGYDSLSMSVTQLSRAKKVLQQFTRSECSAILAEVMRLETAEQIRARLHAEFDQRELTQLIAPKSIERLAQVDSQILDAAHAS
ncbi:MAG: phosphoenolpyruvate--protein phosphotransferase [Litorivicinus sp.]